MPRPKPPAPLKVRYVRLTDKHWLVLKQLGGMEWLLLKQLGGMEWLRELLDKKAPMPKQYYDREIERLNNPADAVFLKRKREEND